MKKGNEKKLSRRNGTRKKWQEENTKKIGKRAKWPESRPAHFGLGKG
jgi:hypothetical protein